MTTLKQNIAQTNGVAKRLRECAYTRVSSKKQVEECASLEEQKRDIERYREANNIELVKIYLDAGISRRKINRPAFNEMLADV